VRNIGILALLLAVIITQTGAEPKVDACGFKGNIHDCGCLTRTDAIRQLIFDECTRTNSDDKGRDECIRHEKHDHCSLAETITRWDQEPRYAEGDDDNNGSELGPMCKRSCKPHHCGCSEEGCDFK
jgi:hypothetical protein